MCWTAVRLLGHDDQKSDHQHWPSNCVHYDKGTGQVLHSDAWFAPKWSNSLKLCSMRSWLSVVAMQHQSCHLHLHSWLAGRNKGAQLPKA